LGGGLGERKKKNPRREKKLRKKREEGGKNQGRGRLVRKPSRTAAATTNERKRSIDSQKGGVDIEKKQ